MIWADKKFYPHIEEGIDRISSQLQLLISDVNLKESHLDERLVVWLLEIKDVESSSRPHQKGITSVNQNPTEPQDDDNFFPKRASYDSIGFVINSTYAATMVAGTGVIEVGRGTDIS